MGCSNSKTIYVQENVSKSECPVKQFLNSEKDYYIEQINTACLAHYCYYIECKGEAAIVDPLRDIEFYLELLKRRGAKLKYVFETHFHADFVSGHLELLIKTGAEIIFGPNAQAEYKITVAKDNDIFKLGNISIQVIHTPGHTLESSCFLILDQNNKQNAILTGDTVFLGEVGRPDLAVKGNISEKDLAGFLYDSLQKLKKLDDEIIIFPGHGAGSACGKKIASGNGDTLKSQKQKNYGLSDFLLKEEFIELATSNLPTPPSYFFHDATLNKNGYESIDEIIKMSFKPLKPQDVHDILNSDDFKHGKTILLDTRDFKIANKSFIKGSIIIPLQIPYAIWTATLFNHSTQFVIINDIGKEKESITRLARVGYHNTIGFLEGGFEEYSKNYKQDLVSIATPDKQEIKKLINDKKISVIDVREKVELENTGKIVSSVNFPLSTISTQIEEINKFDKPLGILCKTGGRSAVAASVLVKNDIHSNSIYMLGSFDDLVNIGIKTEK